MICVSDRDHSLSIMIMVKLGYQPIGVTYAGPAIRHDVAKVVKNRKILLSIQEGPKQEAIFFAVVILTQTLELTLA